jgi:hypothetical protein
MKEDTLEPPEWKDYTFALDVFAKIDFVPWVLSEGMPPGARPSPLAQCGRLSHARRALNEGA